MSMSDPTDNNLLLSSGSSPAPSAQKSDLTPTELHDGHVWARFLHLPLEADASLYIMARDSLKAHLELLDLFISYCRRGSVLPAADAAHAVQTLTELAEQKRKGFRQWKARQASRKSNAGRPSPHANGEDYALALEALAADVATSPKIDVTAHWLAFEMLEAERQKYALELEACRERGEPPPRRTRGRRTNNAQKFNMAMDVQVELEAHPDWSENSAIHKVAKAWHEKHDDADSLQTSSEHASDAKRPVLHDNHVWAYYRHFPLEADPSLYNKAKHSLKSHLELLNLFLDDCQRGSVLPAADAVYAAESLTELAEQRRKGFRQWQARQAGRKSNAGRPSSHAQGEEQALALEALAADVVPSAVINVTAHRLAFELIEAERDKYALQLKACRERGEPPPRRTRGRRTNNAQKFNMAMDVQVKLEAHPDWSENRAIHKVAKAWHKKHDDADHSARDANYRENMIERWHKKIEASYYERKPYLRSTKEPRLDGMIPLELVLDD